MEMEMEMAMAERKLSTNLSNTNILFDRPFMNASGVWCTTKDELCALDKSFSGAVVTKSCTYEYRQGNPKPRYYEIGRAHV